MQLQIERGYLM